MNKITRRDFLKKASAGAVGISFAASIGGSVNDASAQLVKSKIVEVSNQLVWKDDKISQTAVKTMLNDAMMELTDRGTATEAWGDFVSKGDIVGIKVNPLAGPMFSTNRVLIDEIIDGVLSTGVNENNIIIFDRFEEQLINAGYAFNNSKTGVRCYATDKRGPGYDTKIFYETDQDSAFRRENDDPKSYFSKIITKQVTKIINVPVLKQHPISGVSISLKNIAFGSVNNTSRFHPKPINCDPAIAEICVNPVIKDKLVLNIVDGLQASYDKGPTYDADSTWKANLLLLGSDPVAVDHIGLGIIDQKRKDAGLDQVSRSAKHIKTAWQLGLGTNKLNEIEYNQLEIDE